MAVSRFFKPPWMKGRKQFNLNSNKTLKVNKGAAKIFKEYLKSENLRFILKSSAM